MTIIEAIQKVDEMKPNSFTEMDKIKWLSKLDGIIKREIIDTHQGSENIDFNGYDENTPTDTLLLVPAPYEDVYLYWLESRIDYANGEMSKYNNSTAMFNSVYSDYWKDYNRKNMPKTTGFKYF